jgi:hypothetical protein
MMFVVAKHLCSARTVMTALREVIETKGVFCSLYSDRASYFFVTRKEGGKVDPNRLTQVGRGHCHVERRMDG